MGWIMPAAAPVRAGFLETLAERPLVCDGAMGTMLYERGYFINRSFDEANLTGPELVRTIHRSYVRAGATVLETNTFSANQLLLARFGIAEKAVAINEAGRHARPRSGPGRGLRGGLGRARRAKGRACCSDDAAAAVAAAFEEQIEALVANGRRPPPLRDLPPPGRDRDRDPHRPEAVFGAHRRPDVVRGGRQAPRRQHSRAGRERSSAASAPTSSG